MADESAPPQRVRLDPTITLGALIQIATLFAGFTGWLVLGNATSEQTARDVASLQGALQRQAADTRTEIRDSLTRLESSIKQLDASIASLPDLTARTRQLEIDVRKLETADQAREVRFENRRAYVDGRIDELRRGVIEASAALDNLRRASGINLPGARGVRVQ